MNKLVKGLLIGGGVLAIMDISDICAKAYMFHALKSYDENVCDEMMEDMLDECSEMPIISKTARLRSTIITKVTDFYDEIM